MRFRGQAAGAELSDARRRGMTPAEIKAAAGYFSDAD
jgi:hypothetical protein